jgi:hypothetical protein
MPQSRSERAHFGTKNLPESEPVETMKDWQEDRKKRGPIKNEWPLGGLCNKNKTHTKCEGNSRTHQTLTRKFQVFTKLTKLQTNITSTTYQIQRISRYNEISFVQNTPQNSKVLINCNRISLDPR